MFLLRASARKVQGVSLFLRENSLTRLELGRASNLAHLLEHIDKFGTRNKSKKVSNF